MNPFSTLACVGRQTDGCTLDVTVHESHAQCTVAVRKSHSQCPNVTVCRSHLRMSPFHVTLQVLVPCVESLLKNIKSRKNK